MKKTLLIFLFIFSSIHFCFADRLSSAIYNGDLEKVKSCIEEQGIDINRIEDKTTPLWDAIYYMTSKTGSPEGIEIVKYLISKGADINYFYKNFFKGNINASCLDYVIYQSQSSSWKNYYTELFKILYEKGAKISDYSLRWAVNAANTQIIDTLVKSGQLTKNMYTDGLYWTVNNIYVEDRFSGQIQVEDGIKYINLFVKNGADINYKSSSGLSPLIMSVTMFTGDVDTRIMKCLIDNGADVNITDKDGNTVFLSMAPSYWNYYGDKIDIYLNSNPDINIKNKRKQTAISKFITSDIQPENKYDEVQQKKLFDKLLNLNANFFDNDVETPYIILASKYHRNEIVKYLIGIGVDLSIKDSKGKDALYYAYNTEDQELINMLKNPEPVRQAMIEQINAEKKKKEDINKIESIIKNKDFESLKTIMDAYSLTTSFELPNGKNIYDTIFNYFMKDQDKIYLEYLIKDKNYSNITISFNEEEIKWYYSIESFKKEINNFEEIKSDLLREYLRKEIDSQFEINYKNLKTKKQTNPVYYSYIDSNFDSVLIRLIKDKDQKTASNLINQNFVNVKYINAEGKTALDYATEYGLKNVKKSIEKKLKEE